jgi:regulatory protein
LLLTRRPSLSPYARALARLARRDHSEHEIRQALLRDGSTEEQVDETILRLKRERYLDDAGFAERLARSRLAHHGLGRDRVRLELRRKGVGRAVAEAGLAEALREVPEREVLEGLARRFWRSHAKDDPRRRIRKLWAFLVRRGFSAEMVEGELRALWPRWGDALAGLEPEQ